MSWWARLRRQRGATALQLEDEDQRAYLFGESEAEISRLDMQHYLFRWEFGGDFSAPIKAPRAILDVACGTGRWARDVARRFPDAAVVGFDINREQIERSLAEGLAKGTDTLPPNCTFVTADTLQPFAFANSSFDFVMARANSAYLPVSRWPWVVGEMARVTRRGGWVEVRDFALVQSQSQALDKLTLLFAQVAANRGVHPGSGPYLGDYLRGAQLRGVRMRQVTARAGVRGTRGGRLMLIDYLTLLERVTPLVAQIGLLAAPEWEQLLQRARLETASTTTEVTLTAAYGQRV